MLAHELTHVAQQGGNLGVASGPIPLGGEGPAERDAESVAEALTGGGPATPSLRDDRPMLRRQGIGEAGGGCGACKPYELTGTDIHALLSGEFKKLGIKQSPISDPENVKDGVLDLLRVGIVPSIRGDTVVIEIGELKPNNFGQTKKGHRQLERYEAMLRRHLHELVPDSGIHPINISFDFLSDPPPPPAEYSDPSGPSCPKQTVIVSGPAYGLYLYHCKPSRKQIKDCCKQPGDPHPFPIPAIKSGEQPSEESAERETPSVGTEAIEQAARKHDVPEELIYAVMTAISIAILDPEPISKAITSLVALGLSATVAVLILIDLGFGADSPITTPTQSSSST